MNGNKVNRGGKIAEYLGGHPNFPEKIRYGELIITPTQLDFFRSELKPSKIELKPSQFYGYTPVFSIPLQKITGVRVDNAKNIKIDKVLLVGIWAFGWKDKILAIDFKDDTGMQNTAFFKGGKLEEIRNQIIANRYSLLKKKNPKAQKKT
jgi:hypothetical protein